MTGAAELPAATLERVAWGMGLHRWSSRAELEALVDAWPDAPARVSRFAAMPKELEEREIDGVKYQVRPMGGVTGTEFSFRVGRVLMAAFDGNLGALMVTLQTLPPAEYMWAVEKLARSTKVLIVDTAAGPDRKGETPARWVELWSVYDEHFRGALPRCFKWQKFALEANLGDFFAEFAAAFSAVRPKGASPSSFPTTAPGSSGGSSSEEPPGT